MFNKEDKILSLKQKYCQFSSIFGKKILNLGEKLD